MSAGVSAGGTGHVPGLAKIRSILRQGFFLSVEKEAEQWTAAVGPVESCAVYGLSRQAAP